MSGIWSSRIRSRSDQQDRHSHIWESTDEVIFLLFFTFSIYSQYVHPKYIITSSPKRSLSRVIFGSCEIVSYYKYRKQLSYGSCFLFFYFLSMQHLLTVGDIQKPTIEEILGLSQSYTHPTDQLRGKNIVFAFEKPSLRTKVATEVAINQLWGHVIHIDPTIFYSERESLRDTIKNVSEWCNGVFARVFEHEKLIEMTQYAGMNIINALSDAHHPMQAITDLYTMQEVFGKGKITLTFVWDSNNVAYSLAEIALMFGYDIRIASPDIYSFDEVKKTHLRNMAHTYNGAISFITDPYTAVMWADFVYADTFISMWEEWLWEAKLWHFQWYQVNTELMQNTGKESYFMHCLPAHRGIEVTDEVMDSPRSLIYQQAKNRMVTARGVFLKLLGE